MLMRGDLNKIVEQVNQVLEGAFNRIEALENRVMDLENPESTEKRGRGRPPGSKNKPKD